MIIKLDTNNYEGISLAITDEERENGTVDLIQEFCYAMAALFTDFSMKLDCDTEQAKGLKMFAFLVLNGTLTPFLIKVF